MRACRVAATILALAAVVACTPRERALWSQWHTQDPEAAVAFAVQLHAEQQRQPAEPQASSTNSSVWDRVAQCESGQNWAINTGNGYSGGLQFAHAVWDAYGGREFASRAYLASREAQIVVAERILSDVGWVAWPSCSRKLGLR